MLALYRDAGQVAYVYLLNDSDAPVEQEITVADTRRAFRIDPWSGAVVPVAIYRVDGGRTTIPLRLAVNETAVLAFSDGDAFCRHVPRVHGLKSNAELRYHGGKLALRTAVAGPYTVELSDGRVQRVEASGAAATKTLSSWTLEAEEWRPGKTATTTSKLHHRLALAELKPWSAIPELHSASGIGRYTTTVDLGPGWRERQGAWLDLGGVGGTFRVAVNDRKLPPLNQFDTTIDIGPYLRSGKNRIEVIVATTLNNRLLAEGIESDMGGMPKPDDSAKDEGAKPAAPPEGAGPPPMPKGAAAPGAPRKLQAYGLLGPVRLIPYEVLLLAV
jgi:hypothetical protein